MKKRWVIVCLTNRLARMRTTIMQQLSSVTDPSTEFHVVEGSDGIAQALNRSLPLAQHAEFYATIDDDILMPPGWQETIERAFHVKKRASIVSIDFGITPYGRRMMLNADWQTTHDDDGLTFTCVPFANVGGICLVMRGELAREIGPTPIVPGTHYQLYQDYWRCMRARQLEIPQGRGEIWYVRGQEGPAIAIEPSLSETPEELEVKRADIERCNLFKHMWRLEAIA